MEVRLAIRRRVAPHPARAAPVGVVEEAPSRSARPVRAAVARRPGFQVRHAPERGLSRAERCAGVGDEERLRRSRPSPSPRGRGDRAPRPSTRPAPGMRPAAARSLALAPGELRRAVAHVDRVDAVLHRQDLRGPAGPAAASTSPRTSAFTRPPPVRRPPAARAKPRAVERAGGTTAATWLRASASVRKRPAAHRLHDQVAERGRLHRSRQHGPARGIRGRLVQVVVQAAAADDVEPGTGSPVSVLDRVDHLRRSASASESSTTLARAGGSSGTRCPVSAGAPRAAPSMLAGVRKRGSSGSTKPGRADAATAGSSAA